MSGYVPAALMMAIGLVVAVGIFFLSSHAGKKNATPEKMTPYECGNETEGGRFARPSVKFYLMAILFVVFDVEVVFLYPWAILYGGLGWNGFFAMMAFLGLVGVALFYLWRKGALEWED